VAAGSTLEFPAGCFQHTPCFQQHYMEDLQLMLFGYGSANRREDFLGIERFARRIFLGGVSRGAGYRAVTRIYLGQDNQLLTPSCFDGKSDTATRADGMMAELHRQLDILWVIVAPPEDQQIFGSTGDKKNAIF